MKWNWTRRSDPGGDRLAIHWSAGELAWLQVSSDGRPQRAGLERQQAAGDADFARRVRALGLPERGVTALLDLDEAQLLQIDTPAVKPEEMRQAARWRIKELVDSRLEELTIDVMHVGEERRRAAHPQLFVVAARTALIQGLSRRAQDAGLELSVIDIAECAQRNLLVAAARAGGLEDRATALLMRHGKHLLLTIAAGGELYHARRLDWDELGLELAAGLAPAPGSAPMADLDFVDYGAMDDGLEAAGAPRLVVEVQRSFDRWERTWPDLPPAALWVDAGDATPRLTERLSRVIDCPVRALPVEALYPGLADLATAGLETPRLLGLMAALHRE